ncbi:SNF2-related protein [Acutalibacter sp. 1XD8-33]|uniref:SNF2-related protein n=1 Tax=Acutalibacter sp. 1XD8-33 TaxID=2320081 RepID=UPI001FAAB4CA|nr:SNF2-related protein [Acutalibacter sp. 1XD8-33]
MANTKAHFASYDEVKQAHPSDIVLFQRRDFFEMYGPDARAASVELDIHLTNRNIPELGRVAMCSVPVGNLDKFVEMLRKKHGVTISAVTENSAERQTYSLSPYKDAPKIVPSSSPMEPLEQASEQIIEALPQMAPNIEEYIKTKERFPNCVVGVQNGDTIYFYGADAKKAGPALNRHVLTRNIPGMGAVSVTGDAESWQAAQEKLLGKGIDLTFVRLGGAGEYEVITSRTAAEYIPVGMELDVDGRRCRIESVDFQQDAVRLTVLDSGSPLTEPVRYVREYVEDAYARELELAAEKAESQSFVEQVMEDVARLAEQAPTVRELYEKYKGLVIEALGSDQPYRNACQNSDKDTACLDGDAAIKRAVLAAGDVTLTKLYFDNAKFHNDLHREALEETYAILSQPKEIPASQEEPEQEQNSPADEDLTDLQKKAIEIAKQYENLPMEERLAIIAQTFNCKSGKIESSLCTGKWRGTSDISIRFGNGTSLFIGNFSTPKAKTLKVQSECVNKALVWYNPEIVRLTKETALEPLRKQEQKDNAVALEKGLKPYTLLNVELHDGTHGKDAGYLGWYYVTLAVDGKIHAHLESGPNHEISFGKVSENLTKKSFFVAGALEESSVDYIFHNVGFSTAAGLYSLDIADEVRARAEKTLAEREMQMENTPPRDPLAPAYKVGDAVYLEDTAFTITEIGFHDVELQDSTQLYPVFRSESKEEFEKLLRRDERNLFITDYLTYTPNGPIDDGSDLRDALTSNGGLLGARSKKEVKEWLCAGEGNAEISLHLQEIFDGTSKTMTLETGETADYSIYGDRFMLSLLDKSHTVRMYDLWMVAGVLRDMYQRELGGFHHKTPYQVISPDTSRHGTFAPQDSITPAISQTWSKPVAVYPAEKTNLPFDIVIEKFHIEEPNRVPAPQNFHITDDDLGAGGAKAKYQMNISALKTLHKIESEGRTATPDEQETLSKYVGWGALADAFDESKPAWASEYQELREMLTPEEYDSARASVLNSHYTSPTVIKAIYQALENMGFQDGNILEPSCGVGNFFGLLPESMANSKLFGIELDGLTGRIARQLYPNAHIEIKGYEDARFQNNSFDIAIGNVPFGNYKVFDPAYNKLGFSIHNYFFAKTVDQVRPGGIIAFVTSRYTMDSKSTQAREYMAQRAELLGAIRLPNNAFLSNAGTEVVSDILFLQKREQPITEPPDWVQTGENKDGYTINRYFIRHPEMILGEQSSDSTQYGQQDFTVKPIPGTDLGEQLREAITHIEGRYMEAETIALDEEKEQETVPADPEVRNFSYTIVKGDVYYRQDSVMVKMELGATAKARVTALIDLRDCTRRLINKQMELSARDEEIKSAQAELNRLYDNFTRKFGLVNDKTNERTFCDDSSYYLLCALEILDDEGKFVRKADMFTKRTILPRQEITHVDTAAEALAMSIGNRARVDLPYMAGLTGKTEEEIIHDLHGQIFRVPFRDPPIYQTADEYLSGNVREKLSIAEVAAGDNPDFNINVSALEAVQPKDLEASEISVRLGTDWIESEYVEQFMYELLKTPRKAREDIHVQYSSVIHVWNISCKTHVRKDDVLAHSTYGTRRVSAYKLLEDALNLQSTRVYDTITANGGDKRVLNAKETTLAQQKQSMIKLAFQDWIWKDLDRRQKLVRKYNEEMNCIRPRQYDGSHLVLDGMNPEIQLEEHQKNAIARAVYGGNTLFAHCVGAGKTFEITASAMEMKRLGLCSKSMIVVPNHLTQQWASEFLRLYLNANILVTTKRDFEKDRRKKFCSRIATGDYDAVIIGYSQFEKIPVSKERQIRQLNQQMDAIIDGIARAKEEDGQHFTVKNMERTKRSLESRLKKLQADNRKDTVIDFEELGIDRLFVDESDNFKNLFLVTKMQNVAGLSTSDAQKSSDMFSKTQYLDEITDYKGVIFATGTPISNSITEMFTVQRYLQNNALKAMGMEHFDSWASRFGETVTTMELAPEGTYRPRTRFAKFFNLPELMNIFHEVADIKTEDMLNLPTPDVEFHNIVAQPSEYQREYVQELSERATAVRAGSVDPTKDNLLKITNDGRKQGLDQRLISPFAEDEPGSKLNLCVENIMKFWQEGKEEKLTQLVFSDLSTPKKDGSFNVYNDIKSKLVANGVPENEVAFIHDAETEVKKKELFAKVRSGKVRVLIGSTQKLGAGTNIQDRLIALHHLDCPWRPRDVGRILRTFKIKKNVEVTDNGKDDF